MKERKKWSQYNWIERDQIMEKLVIKLSDRIRTFDSEQHFLLLETAFVNIF